MSYATVEDVQSELLRDLSEREQEVCTKLLEKAGRMIDRDFPYTDASDEIKGDISVDMVKRVLGSGDDVPMGATQGSMAALGYSQSWTISSGGSIGELYFTKEDRRRLGAGNRIGSYSPVQELVYDTWNNNTTTDTAAFRI